MQSQWIAILGSFVLVSAAPAAHAEWKGKGEAGILFARGNTDTDTINVKVDMSREVDRWKNSFGLSAIRAANNGDATAKRYEGHWQTDYKLSERSFWFGGLRYEKDEFSGFDYQASLASGYGYKFVDTEITKFSGQIGAGYRRIKNALDGSTSGDAVATGKLNFEHALTSTTKVLDQFVVEAGSSNTLAQNELALQVKMSDTLALSVGLGVRYNTKPPATKKKTDTITTLNLVYAF
jgi:putative salt-induced outer membrane protein